MSFVKLDPHAKSPFVKGPEQRPVDPPVRFTLLRAGETEIITEDGISLIITLKIRGMFRKGVRPDGLPLYDLRFEPSTVLEAVMSVERHLGELEN